jgi:outer membrane protein
MKKLFKSALVAACVLMVSSFAQAQTKIGYLNFQNIVTATRQFADIQKQMETYQNQFMETIKAVQAEGQTKAADYEAKKATMTDAVRTKAESELQDLNKRLQDLNTSAQNSVQQKYNELTKPLVDKVKAAVNQVAKEKGYTYVLDSSTTDLIVAPEADDLTAAVKVKLGPDMAPATTAAPVRKP